MLTVRRGEGHLVVVLRGEWDVARAPLLRRELMTVADADPTATVVVDLTRVSFLDVTCLGVLAAVEARLTAGGGRLHVRHPGPMQRRVLSLTGLDRLVDEPTGPVAGTRP